MELKERAEQAVSACVDALGETLTVTQRQTVTAIIEQAMIDAVLQATQHSSTAVRTVCEHEMDMAHKLNAEIERANAVLVTNLTGMRS